MSKVTSIISQTLKTVTSKSDIPPVLSKSTGSLYEVLSRRPDGGVGMKVHQTRWGAKQIPNSYWLITRAQFKNEGKNGKAWGKLFWKGNCVSENEERISGSLKYSWKEGPSRKMVLNIPSIVDYVAEK
ncbi:hypothetical protein CPB83DRAFT_831070 [Crepidotus variabilis]|uniref:Uncharacterized protein n=1 Tax=Crepidotus variabilis TaxID=179855 RepID=A0A9P6EU72_9AGAR|nr:hypothetical protein CPB83DRAFT_831070 [Crepidotus variabilis]